MIKCNVLFVPGWGNGNISVSCHKNPPTVVRNANTDSYSLLSENNDLFVTFTVTIMLPPKHHSLVKVCVCVGVLSFCIGV